MKYLYKTIIVCCYTTPLFSQNCISFSLGSEYYMTPSSYRDISGISLAWMHQVSSSGDLGLRFNWSTLSYQVSSPATAGNIQVSAYDIYLVYGYSFADQIFGIDLKPVIGAGIKILNRESFDIDLGAFGIEKSPQRSEEFFSSFLSLVFFKNISRNLNFFIEPGYAFYNTRKMHKIFSLRGGIDVLFN